MASLNKVMLIGRLGQDPEKRVTSSGLEVVSCSMATSEKIKDKEYTEWHKLSVFGKLANIFEQYLKKGSLCYIEGRIQTNEWTDKDGNKRYDKNIIVNQMQMLDSRNQSNQDNSRQYSDDPMEDD